MHRIHGSKPLGLSNPVRSCSLDCIPGNLRPLAVLQRVLPQVEQMNRGYVFDTIRDASGMVGMIMSHMPQVGSARHPGSHLLLHEAAAWADRCPFQFIHSVTLCLPERFLTSLLSLDTLTLESMDFDELAYQIFLNPGCLPKYPPRAPNVDSCFPWRIGYAEPGEQQVARQTNMLEVSDVIKNAQLCMAP